MVDKETGCLYLQRGDVYILILNISYELLRSSVSISLGDLIIFMEEFLERVDDAIIVLSWVAVVATAMLDMSTFNDGYARLFTFMKALRELVLPWK